jgi:2,3,4,5-tetrahydropyridine-2-carboxylate N-succinyltransferase
MNALQTIIEQAWENRVLLQEETTKTIREVIALLDSGALHVAEPKGDTWQQVNEWVKKAVVMYFPIQKWKPGKLRFLRTMTMELKKDYAAKEFSIVQGICSLWRLHF